MTAALDAQTPLATKLEHLHRSLAALDSLLVAFSGGADSAFVLAAAVRALGTTNVVAGTAVSPSLPAVELAAVAGLTRTLGVRHELAETDEMSRPGYRANAGDRCYFCKAELVETLQPIADEFGIEAIATGTNADDAIAGFRPGIRAAHERGAVTPLKDARLTKAQIREASRRWGLATSEKPAAACLSSRIAYGIRITPNLLARVDRAERAVRDHLTSYDVRNVRVRDLGEKASIEIDAELLSSVDTAELEALVRAEGFAVAGVDPRGFRSGSMNERLADPGRYR